MKRFLLGSVVLVFVFAMVGLIGCGQNSGSTDTPVTASSMQTASAEAGWVKVWHNWDYGGGHVFSIKTAGDLNNDGVKDLLVEASKVYTSEVDLLSGKDGSVLKVYSSTIYSFGSVIASYGIGEKDILIGAPEYRENRIIPYVEKFPQTLWAFPGIVFGYPSAGSAYNFSIKGNPVSTISFGRSLCNTFDFNEDGIPDFAVGSKAAYYSRAAIESTYECRGGVVSFYSGTASSSSSQLLYRLTNDSNGFGGSMTSLSYGSRGFAIGDRSQEKIYVYYFPAGKKNITAKFTPKVINYGGGASDITKNFWNQHFISYYQDGADFLLVPRMNKTFGEILCYKLPETSRPFGIITTEAWPEKPTPLFLPVCAADINGDGRKEIMVAYSANGGNGGSVYDSLSFSKIGTFPYWACDLTSIGDSNGDGREEVAVLGEGVNVYKYTGK